MQDHRIRLNDDDCELVCSALRARLAAVSDVRARQIRRLLDRLEDGGRGNPALRFGGDHWEGGESPTRSGGVDD